MTAIRIEGSVVPDDAQIEVWADNTVWIVLTVLDRQIRLPMREWAERSRTTVDVPFEKCQEWGGAFHDLRECPTPTRHLPPVLPPRPDRPL